MSWKTTTLNGNPRPVPTRRYVALIVAVRLLCGMVGGAAGVLLWQVLS